MNGMKGMRREERDTCYYGNKHRYCQHGNLKDHQKTRDGHKATERRKEWKKKTKPDTNAYYTVSLKQKKSRTYKEAQQTTMASNI